MLKVNRQWYFFFIVWFTFISIERAKEISSREPKNANSKEYDESRSNNKEEQTNKEIEDAIDDDYIKISIFTAPEFRAVVNNRTLLWENGIVPYEISDDFDIGHKKAIQEAMLEFHRKTCVRFQERREEKAYIFIAPGSGCSAVVGKVPDAENKVNLSENCFVRGIILHELMHTLGFIHEHNRPDRDEYVTINFGNIKKGEEKIFVKVTPDVIDTFNIPYDYESVMHYGVTDSAINLNVPVIEPKKAGVKIGQREGFSEKDLQKINIRYCFGKQNAVNDKNESLADDGERQQQ